MLLLAILSGSTATADTLDLLQPIGYVTDAAGIIDPGTERKIAELSEELERKTGVRVVVVTLPTIDGVGIEVFAAELLKYWVPSADQRAHTILLLDALAEEKFRMELGSVVDTLMSSQCSERVQNQVLLPCLRSGDKNMAYLLTITELADEIARRRDVTLYRLKGPGYLRNLPAAAVAPPEPRRGKTQSLWFLPALMATLWIGYRETRAVTRRAST